ncbi:MAG: helix-turn-helix transcriptional regulator [Bacteroidia bacterium]|nr:helix-turn-helix transcriptional regulator [Bacteroidia bacterium]
MERFYNLIFRYQRYILGIALFLLFFAVSVEVNGGNIELVWRDHPQIALLIIVAGLVFLFLYIEIDKIRIKKLSTQIKEQSDKEEDHAQLLNQLTARQREVYDLILLGKSNKEISGELYIEPSTLKTHINHIYKKLNIQSRRELRNKYSDSQ